MEMYTSKRSRKKMIKNKLILTWITVLLLITQVDAFTTTNGSITFEGGITSGKNNNVSSTNYITYVVVGEPTDTLNSSNFKTNVGLLRTLPYLNGEACEVNAECVGNFCCSNVCQSTACPVQKVITPGGGASAAAGGGGIFIQRPPEKDFSLSKDAIKIELSLGEEKSETLTITNTGRSYLNFSLSIGGEIKEFLTLSDISFTLLEEESKTISLDFIGKRVGSFTGSIIVKGDNIEKIIPTLLEIESEVVLFDVKLDIPSEYKKIRPSDELKAQITLFSLGPPEKVNVTINYFIKDLNGDIVLEETEILTVQNQLSFLKSFKIPEDSELGTYTLSIEVLYADSFAVSSEIFKIVEGIKELEIAKYTTIISYIILTIFIISLLISIYFVSNSKYRTIKRSYRDFNQLFEEAYSKIKNNMYKEAVIIYYELNSAYKELLEYPFEDKVKIHMYKKIRQVYEELKKIKENKK